MISYNSSGIIRLTFDIPNSEVQNITSGNAIQFYNASSIEPGFVIIAAALKYYNANDTLDFDDSEITIQTQSNSICTYGVQGNPLSIGENNSIVFLTSYNTNTSDYVAPDDFKKLAISFNGNYVSGNGNIRITLFGFYQ